VPHINIEVTDELLKAMRLRCIESGERQKDWVVARLTEAASGKPNRSDPVGVQSAPRGSSPEYDKIPTGVFAATLMRESIKKAEAAVASGEVVEMVKALDDVKSWNL